MAQNSIPATATATDALLAAYLAARYRFEFAGRWWPLAVGQPAPPVLAQVAPARRWSLLTAYNPHSVAQPPAVNTAADVALQAALEAIGATILRAAASAPDGSWEEPGWLVGGLEDGEADALARRHGQAGILHWHGGGPVRLRMYRACTPGREQQRPCVDWIGLAPR